MTNYIVCKKIVSLLGNQIIYDLKSFFDLPSAKEYYEKIKNQKKKVPLIFANQILKTSLILMDIGNTTLLKEGQEYFKKEILEEYEVNFKDEKQNEIQKQKN